MKHNDKAWQDDNSARLDALLSDFLDKDIVAFQESQSFSHPTSAPLGDLFPDAGRLSEPTSLHHPLPTPAAPQKVAPVNRTEEKVNSMLEASAAAARGKKFFYGSIAAILLLTAAASIWQSRRVTVPQPSSDEPTATVSPSESDETVSNQALAGTPDVPESQPAASQANGFDPLSNSRHGGPAAVALPASDSALEAAATPSTIKGVSQSIASNAANLQRMAAPTLGRSNFTLGTIQDLPSLQSAPPVAPLPLPPPPTGSSMKNVAPDVTRTTAAIPAVALTKVQPFYPELARRMKVTGTVHVAIVVDTAGKVISARAIDGSPVLQGSAERAVKQWRFKPSTMNGEPVIGSGTVSIMFSPDQR